MNSRIEQNEAKELSVVVASASTTVMLKKCLDSILANECQNVEIIVSHNSADQPLVDLTPEYPGISFIEFSKNTTLPVLWAAGISRSSGEIVAVTESACVVAEDWVSVILAAHQTTFPVIGGTVEMSESERLVDWAAYFCEYGQFMFPVPTGPVHVLPGNNISFKRWTLEKYEEFVEGEFWKTYLCQQLQTEGVKLISSPSMLVHYSKSYELWRFLVRRFHHGRCFAGMRIKCKNVFTRAIYALGTIILPAVFFVRTIAPVLQKRRYWKKFVLSLPISILAILVWSVGETCGYLTGTGISSKYIY